MRTELRPERVETMPEHSSMDESVLYISLKYEIVIHLCPCGCKNEVVTPVNGIGDWELTEESGEWSLHPSIGNYQIPCKSHYYIKKNKIVQC